MRAARVEARSTSVVLTWMAWALAAALLGMLAADHFGTLAASASQSTEGAAEATEPASPEGVRAGRAALALLSIAPEQLGYSLTFAAPRPGLRAQIDLDARAVTVFVRPGDASHLIAHDIAHELGHAYDVELMDDSTRADYLRERGIEGAEWWPEANSEDYGTGAGDFAEVFALCHAPSPVFRSRLASGPTDPCSPLPLGARSDNLEAP